MPHPNRPRYRRKDNHLVRRIWLIRHGECAISAGAAFATFAGAPLTPHGAQQARQIAEFFVEPPDLLVTSSYLRAQQTAQPTLRRFPHLRCEEWPIQEFTYLTFPTDHPVTKAELRPQAEAYWGRGDPDYCDGPQAESFTTFIQRAQQTLVTLRCRPEPFLALFSHEFFMSAILWTHLTHPKTLTAAHMRQFQAFANGVQWPNAAILPLCLDSGDGMDSELWIGSMMTSHLAVQDGAPPPEK